ncbi:MAG: hypothetical protein ABL998_20825 [Planctomycetota bacterium]
MSFTVETRAFRAGDERWLAAALERARAAAGGGRCRDEQWLGWRYAAAPHGGVLAVARDERGVELAGLVATRRRVRFEGQEVFWLELGDLWNDFSRGGGLARARPLLAAGTAFAEAFCGFAPEKHPLVYGLPNRRAHRIGLAKLEWEVLRSENELALDLARPLPSPPPDVQLEEPARFPLEIEIAFLRHAEGRGALLWKDAAVLHWSHVARPGARAELALVRRASEPVGFAVHERGRMLEFATAAGDASARLALVAWAAARARAAGAARLTAVLPDTAPEFLALQQLGFRVGPTCEFLCFRSFQRPAIMSWLFKHWSYSRADTQR